MSCTTAGHMTMTSVSESSHASRLYVHHSTDIFERVGHIDYLLLHIVSKE